MPRKMRDSGVEWIGQIPVEWRVQPLRTVVSQVIDRAADSTRYIGLENVESGSGKYVLANASIIDGMTVAVKPHDILFGKLRPYLAKCVEVLESGCCSTEFLVLRSLNYCPTYLKYIMLSPTFVDSVNMSTYGTKMPRANWDYVRQMIVPVPELSVQRQIAQHLGVKCKEIDSSIESARQSIEDYKALKKSLVFELVTGKNRSGRKVSSGVDWIGDVPADWPVCRIVSLYREVSERGDDSLPILSVSINTGVSDKELSDEEQERVFIRSEDKSKYKRVQPGDLTYNMMRAWQGAFGAVRVDGMVSPAYVVARPKAKMDSRYVEYLLRTPNATREMQRYSRGIADFRMRLYWPEFKNIKIPCPPLAEQRALADEIGEKCGAIDALVAEKESLIADLEQYKKSLIFECVTGKREVA